MDLESTCRCLSVTSLHLLPGIQSTAIAVSDSIGDALICVASRDDGGALQHESVRRPLHVADLLTKERLLDGISASFSHVGRSRSDADIVHAAFSEIPAAVVLTPPAERANAQPLRASDPQCQTLLSTIRQQVARCCGRVQIFPNALHLESMAEFCAGAGHEINNPLGSIVGQVQRLKKLVDSPDAENALATIGAQAWRVRDMIGDAMTFARPPEANVVPCDVAEVLDEVEDSLADECRRADARLTALWHSSDSELTVHADATQIRNLISLLVRNSLEAIAGAGLPGSIEVECREAESPDFWQISVRDDGPGIADELVRRHLFDPCFSGRQAGRGLGFGLPLAWRIAMAHGGCLQFANREPAGCEFLVTLPTNPVNRRIHSS